MVASSSSSAVYKICTLPATLRLSLIRVGGIVKIMVINDLVASEN
jgi:hypothetical protein